MTNDELAARDQCKQALINKNLEIHLCDSCRRKYCPDKISRYSGRRMIFCQKYKVKKLSKEI